MSVGCIIGTYRSLNVFSQNPLPRAPRKLLKRTDLGLEPNPQMSLRPSGLLHCGPD